MLTQCRWPQLALIWALHIPFLDLPLLLHRVDQNFKIRGCRLWHPCPNNNSSLLSIHSSNNCHLQCQVPLVQAVSILQELMVTNQVVLTYHLILFSRGLAWDLKVDLLNFKEAFLNQPLKVVFQDLLQEAEAILYLFIKLLSLTLILCKTQVQLSFIGLFRLRIL